MDTRELQALGRSPTKYRFITNPIRSFIFWAIRPYLAGLPDWRAFSTRTDLKGGLERDVG